MDAAEIVAIQQLYAHYGHVMDDREWSYLEHVFTPDVVFDATALGIPLVEGTEALRELASTSPMNPLAHHATNVLVESIVDGTATVRAKSLAIYEEGKAFSGVTDDTLVRTDDGWRISHRVAWRVEQAA